VTSRHQSPKRKLRLVTEWRHDVGVLCDITQIVTQSL